LLNKNKIFFLEVMIFIQILMIVQKDSHFGEKCAKNVISRNKKFSEPRRYSYQSGTISAIAFADFSPSSR
jgi:hypothetical protein